MLKIWLFFETICFHHQKRRKFQFQFDRWYFLFQWQVDFSCDERSNSLSDKSMIEKHFSQTCMKTNSILLNQHIFEIIWFHFNRCRKAIHNSKIQTICYQHENHDQNRFRWNTSFDRSNRTLSWIISSHLHDHYYRNFRHWFRTEIANDFQNH